jgi:hypothetical protein
MNGHTPKEHLPTSSDYLDTEGDIRHHDDNPEGFNAKGTASRESDHTREDAEPVVDTYYDELAEQEEIPGAYVELGFRATHLLLAADSYAKASMLRGLLRANNRRKIAEYGGELFIQTSIQRNIERGRQALRAGYGIDAMLARPDMIPNEFGQPYDTQQAEDDLVAVQAAFRRNYTADGVRLMHDASALEKAQKSKEVSEKRDSFRRTLARQAVMYKTQS